MFFGRTLQIVFLWLLCLLPIYGYDVPGFTPDEIVEYKQTTDNSGGAVGLDLHVFKPEGHQAGDLRPAIVFFFGGGWSSGSPSQFHPHCEYLAGRGMVAISAEYRVSSLHGTSPEECVKDGKSAIRWVRENAASLGIDPDRIAAGGGSAGGHVAAATGTLRSYDEPGENLSISSKPNALVLFNPVYDNGPTGYGYSRVQAYWEDFSPLHNIDGTAPPTAVFLGTNDSLIPVATAENYQALMEAEGIRSDLHLYQNQPHGFFNFEVPDDGSGPWYGYQSTAFRMDEFLVSLDYLVHPVIPGVAVGNWKTIFGDAGFVNGSGLTSSPITTDAAADAIAANISPLILNDGGFVRVTGSVTFDVPLTGSNFRVGLFDGDNPVTTGDGTGYVGIWAEAPATSETNIAKGEGTGSSHPFETAGSLILGSIPGAPEIVPANTPVGFSLMIAGRGSNLDVTVDFTDGGSYRQSQNLLNLPVSAHQYDSVAFLMTGNLNGTQASFKDLQITSGPVVPFPDRNGAGNPVNRTIIYVEAVAGEGGNTFTTNGSPRDTSWISGDDSGSGNESLWTVRTSVGGNFDTVFQAVHEVVVDDEIPELTTQITGLADGTYTIWAFYWDQVVSSTQNWTLSTGLTSGALETYSSPGQPVVPGATTSNVSDAGRLNFSTNVDVIINQGEATERRMFGVNLGEVAVSGGMSTVNVYVDNLIGNNSLNRTWFDGVGYARVPFDPAHKVTSFISLGGGMWELTLEGLPGTDYVLRSSLTLDFASGSLLENLTQGKLEDPGVIGGGNNDVVTTDGNGEAKVRLSLSGSPADFVRVEVSP